MKIFYSLILIVFSFFVKAQVGVNTENPNEYSVLDIKSNDKGILIPRIPLQSIFDTNTVKSYNTATSRVYENSLLVYNTFTSSLMGADTEKNVTPGYYYWETDRWVRMASHYKKEQQFFYMPSIIIPTSQDQVPQGQFGHIDLHSYYIAQFANSFRRNPGATTMLPVYSPTQLDYYITWYDETVFSNVNVSDEGILTYSVIPNADITIGSFMNIIFAIK